MTRMYNALFGARAVATDTPSRDLQGPLPPPAPPSAPPRRAAAEPEPEATDEPVGLRRRRHPRRRRSLSDDAEEPPHRPRDSPRARDAVGAWISTGSPRTRAKPAADANLAVPLRADHVDGDGEGDAQDEDEAEAARRALRERVAFLADTLLAVLREVDARLTSGRVADQDGVRVRVQAHHARDRGRVRARDGGGGRGTSRDGVFRGGRESRGGEGGYAAVLRVPRGLRARGGDSRAPVPSVPSRVHRSVVAEVESTLSHVSRARSRRRREGGG